MTTHPSEECRRFFPDIPTHVISSACDTTIFTKREISEDERECLYKKFGLTGSFILCMGGYEERKNAAALIRAYAQLSDALRNTFQLVFPASGYPFAHMGLANLSENLNLSSAQVRLLPYVSDNDLRDLYTLCALFVFPSLEEGFGLPMLEAMQCGAPVIASNTTSMPEVIGLEEALFDPRDIPSIQALMARALSDEAFRERLVANSHERSKLFSWDRSACLALAALEECAARHPARSRSQGGMIAVRDLCRRLGAELDAQQTVTVADCIARTFCRPRQSQLLVDIGNLALEDAKSGIQRVVRSVGAELAKRSLGRFALRFVRPDDETSGYAYAHEAGLRLFDHDDGFSADMPVDYAPGDVFLGLDFVPHSVLQKIEGLRIMHRHGVKVYFVVYDLLAVRFPQYCSTNIALCFPKWLQSIGEFDGLICISRAVAGEVRQWMQDNKPEYERKLNIQWFHLGGDIENSLPTRGFPDTVGATLRQLGERPTILMVSTVEPRKGYRQVLDACDALWTRGVDFNLAIVGQLGWKMDDFARRLNRHAERNRRLFWLRAISDDYLEAAYKAASAVLMASEGEGFGLAVIEGARHGCPLILRDIPVFREIAGDNAFYFSGLETEALAAALETWLKLHEEGKTPSSTGIRCLTWKESTDMLLEVIL